MAGLQTEPHTPLRPCFPTLTLLIHVFLGTTLLLISAKSCPPYLHRVRPSLRTRFCRRHLMGTLLSNPRLRPRFPTVVPVHRRLWSVDLFIHETKSDAILLLQSSSSASATSSPYVHALTHPHGPCPGCYACTGRPDQPGWQPVPPTSLPALEEPVYTRRQVKEMIDVVSDCLIETMVSRSGIFLFFPLIRCRLQENVLTRPGQPGDILQVDSPNGQLVRSLKEDGFRQTVLSEAIPRVYYRMQNGNPRV